MTIGKLPDAKQFTIPFVISFTTIVTVYFLYCLGGLIAKSIWGLPFYFEMETIGVALLFMLILSIPNILEFFLFKLKRRISFGILLNFIYFFGWVSYFLYLLILYFIVDSSEIFIEFIISGLILILIVAIPIFWIRLGFKEAQN